MTKLITIDMDGTLLDSCKQLPTDTNKILSGLIARGIRIVIASGKQRASLEAEFGDLARKLILMCENGGMLFLDGELLNSLPIAAMPLKNALHKVRVIAHHYPIFCGVKSAYIEDSDPEFYEAFHQYYPNVTSVENLEDVIGTDSICKIAVFNTHADDVTESELLKITVKDLCVIGSSNGCIDIARADATKGAALRFLQDYYGITKQECMVFGDCRNDIDMMNAVEESYAVANAAAEVKAAAKHICSSNDEMGVLRILKHV